MTKKRLPSISTQRAESGGSARNDGFVFSTEIEDWQMSPVRKLKVDHKGLYKENALRKKEDKKRARALKQLFDNHENDMKNFKQKFG